jgi:hypothetical protein
MPNWSDQPYTVLDVNRMSERERKVRKVHILLQFTVLDNRHLHGESLGKRIYD